TVSTTTLNITNSLDSTVYPSLPTPTYPGGATFLGWYTKDGYQAKAGEKLTDRHDPTLYAQWKLNNITVTFNPQGGTVSPASKVIEAGKPYGTLPVPTRPGYVFEGWVRSATSHSFVNASTSAGTANHTLYAVWTQAAAVKIRGYVASRKVDFRTTITFTAQPENAPANVEFYWYVNGERQGDNQQSITLGEVRDDFEIQVLMRTADNDIFVYSEKEKVEVKKGFFDKFTAFFKGLFHILPVINQ
ncbi:MAG: InlB B-repeat-containing protein, partial [Clostridia bacterium]|nr:InlB B-repeat-containing protein [Clostridia bacterium]